MARQYRIGLIGAGARGETFARQLFQGLDCATLFGICDRDEDRLTKFTQHLGITGVPLFTDPEQFFAQDKLDAVIVTTPEFTHAPVAIAAMQAGKHVYLEKPLAHTLEGCYDIIRAQKETGVTAYVGFNLRASLARQKLKAIVNSGRLGQIVHIDGLEQLSQAHGASFMRRFHRLTAQSGGLMNHKCSHDLDIMQWLVGHEHKVVKVASFGGINVLRPEKRPAERCRDCPPEIYRNCAYKAAPGFVFPIATQPIYHRQGDIYGGDLCVYNDEKDIIDNQTIIMEWDNGVRGNFNLQMFQNKGVRRTVIYGEKGLAAYDEHRDAVVRVTDSDTGDTEEYRFAPRPGGHGGTDMVMIRRFVETIDGGVHSDSGLDAGLAATLVALKADESRRSGQMINIAPEEYDALAMTGKAISA